MSTKVGEGHPQPALEGRLSIGYRYEISAAKRLRPSLVLDFIGANGSSRVTSTGSTIKVMPGVFSLYDIRPTQCCC